MEVCSACHQDKHKTFTHTGMGMSFDSAYKSKSSGSFDGHQLVYDSSINMYYYPFWKGEQLTIREFRLLNYDTIHKLDVDIDYIVGSGQHTNSHIFKSNGYLYQAPITFYVQDKKWDLAPGFENGNNTRFSRIINSECISCHNSMPQLKNGNAFKFERIGKGIDCERCHGPGELHVNERSKGIGVDVKNEIDPTIVNPSKLSWELQTDLCQRCHLQGLNILKEGKSFLDFKPGMKLSSIFDVYLPQYLGDNLELDMANHSQRFQMSKCFISGNNKDLSFTCISCHNPHISVKETGTEVFNASCNNCHNKDVCSAEKAKLLKAQNNCVECHMPKSGSEDIPHVSVHDHFIRKPISKSETEEVKKLIGLYAINNPNPKVENQIRAYLEYWEKFDKNNLYLEKAKILLEKSDFPKLELKYYYLKEDYKQATQLVLSDAVLDDWECLMLGDSYLKLGLESQGLYYLEKAYLLNKSNRTISKKLLNSYLKNLQVKSANEIIGDVLAEFPKDPSIINCYAQSLILMKMLPKAKVELDKAIKLDPDNIEIWETYLNYSLRTNKMGKIKYWGHKILEANPNHPNKKDIEALLYD